MNACVVDASVVVQLFFTEPHTEQARLLVMRGTALHAPELLGLELDSAVWKRVRRREISFDEAREAREGFAAMRIASHSIGTLRDRGFDLAVRTGRSVYDCLYLALAVKTGCPLITADKRLVNALADTPLAKHVAWIGGLR